MREIKFRAWNGETCKMTYYDFLYTSQVKNFSEGTWSLDKLMQYTGLKDNNGKEIYEGDIVKTRAFGDRTTIVNWNKIAWFAGGDFMDAIGQSHEIIGNIWENPELLTSK